MALARVVLAHYHELYVSYRSTIQNISTDCEKYVYILY